MKPAMTLALGATASLGVLGRKVAVTQERGQPLTLQDGSTAMITVHPSYLLRLPDEGARAREHERFIADLAAVGARL